MASFLPTFRKYPARASFVAYLALIVVGAACLYHPACCALGKRPWTVVECLFTATSAVCVTGLSVRSTAHDLSALGQALVLGMIQIGGIGIMTITSYIALHLRGRISLRQRAIASETLGDAGPELPSVLRNVLLITAICEGAGFLSFAIRNLQYEAWPTALWHALFHAISAFCNAGFALHDDSFVRYQSDAWVNLTTILLIVIGGLGFPVLTDLLHARRRRKKLKSRALSEYLTLHTRLMLLGTAALLLLGTVAFFAIEYFHAYRSMPLGGKLLAALFQSTTCRTAGFNTVEMAELTNASLFVTILLMLIGGGPCSTAGGFKVSTLMVLLLRGWSSLQGRTSMHVMRRKVPSVSIERAMTTALMFTVVTIVALTSVLVLEQSWLPHRSMHGDFMNAAFEVVSALGTVGLSIGITEQISIPSHLILMVLMFLGRLGPITVSLALSLARRELPYEYPEEAPLIG